MEMIKGIQGHGYYDELVVPIIENTAYEFELTESLAKAVCFVIRFTLRDFFSFLFMSIYGWHIVLCEEKTKKKKKKFPTDYNTIIQACECISSYMGTV